MEPSPEPPPNGNNSLPPKTSPPPPSESLPDIPFRRIALRPSFPEPDSIRATPADYLPKNEQLSSFAGELRTGLRTLVQGPLDYRLTNPLTSWNGSELRVQQGDFETAAHLVTAALDIGPHTSPSNPTPLETEDWGVLASACLAAIARGFTRPLKEASRKAYTAYWESLEDNSQRKLDEGENPEFHSLLQRLKATSQHLDIHINADETDGMQKWTRTVRKEIEETARRTASAEVKIALYNWKTDQLTIRQQQLEEDLKRTVLKRNVELLRDTASTLGLTLGDVLTPLQSRPVPTTGNKRTASGSTPQPARTPKPNPPPSVPVAAPPQTPALDVITLTAAVQTAMQPFMARLAAIESLAVTKNRPGTDISNTGPRQTQTREQVHQPVRQPAPDQQRITAGSPPPEAEWVQVTNRGKKGKKGKADPTPQ